MPSHPEATEGDWVIGEAKHSPKRNALWRCLRLAGLVCLCASQLQAFEPSDRDLNGQLYVIGSDSLNLLVIRWAEAFQSFHPGVRVSVAGKGSVTAPPALIENTAQLGLMSRPLSAVERVNLQTTLGTEPLEIVIARDALAIIVHPSNPIESLTLADLATIYGREDPAERWGSLEGAGMDGFISLHGRNSASGTYGSFQASVLGTEAYSGRLNEHADSGSVLWAVAREKSAIGYLSFGRINELVRVVPIAESADSPALLPGDPSGLYPLERALYIYARPLPTLSPLTLEFLAYVLSPEAQQENARQGLLPIAPDDQSELRRAIDHIRR